MESTYNGWTNYATWRVNLEIIDGSDHLWIRYKTIKDVADAMREYVKEIIEENGKGSTLNYALAFINDVNWDEIARQYYQEQKEEEEEEEELI